MKRIVVVPDVKGQAPTRVPADEDPPVPLDLLPPLSPTARATLIDVLADLVQGDVAP